MTLGQRIRAAREAKGWTAAGLARKTRYRLDAWEVRGLESGKYNATADDVRRICRTLGISADWLLDINLPRRGVWKR